jgi:hypothetical protein
MKYTQRFIAAYHPGKKNPSGVEAACQSDPMSPWDSKDRESCPCGAENCMYESRVGIVVTSALDYLHSKDSDCRTMEERINEGDHDGLGDGFGLVAKK